MTESFSPGAMAAWGFDEAALRELRLPPNYPDHPLMRRDWYAYLRSVEEVDRKVGRILAELEAEGVLQRPIPPDLTRRNITISAGPVPTTPGVRLRVGETLLEVVLLPITYPAIAWVKRREPSYNAG